LRKPGKGFAKKQAGKEKNKVPHRKKKKKKLQTSHGGLEQTTGGEAHRLELVQKKSMVKTNVQEGKTNDSLRSGKQRLKDKPGQCKTPALQD